MPKRKLHKKEEIVEEVAPVAKKMVVVEETPEATHVEELNSTATKAEVIAEPVVEASPVVEIPEPVLQTSQPVEVVEPVNEESKTNYLFIIVPVALLVGALVGGLITYFSGLSRLADTNATPSPVPTVAATEETPVPSPVPTVKREEIKLQVLNGSGISGYAGKAKTLLEGLGYKNVAAGNASVSNLTETKISVKGENKEALEVLRKDLTESYTVASETDTLPASSPYDFVITLGSK